MFDRVFICPQCGEAGGCTMFIPCNQNFDGIGVTFRIRCDSCACIIRSVELDYELVHRFLRRCFKHIRTDSGVYRPGAWQPIFCSAHLGKYAKTALQKQVTDCIWYGQRAFGETKDSWLKLGAHEQFESLIRFIVHTAVHPHMNALTSRDFLSWCFEFNQDHCFG